MACKVNLRLKILLALILGKLPLAIYCIRILFFFLALFLLFANQASGSGGNFSAPVFVIPQGGPATIPAAHLEFLEGADETAGFEFLEKAEWAPKLVADQSLVEGYWVRLRVQNTLLDG